ncbi:MAG: alginate lyase family protein [Mariniphaga sp.]|nr:alginate lyase family protein [Mariniphaga sp.]
MTTKILLFVITLALTITGCNSIKVETADVRLGGWDYSWMEKVKDELNNGESTFHPSFSELIKDADEALEGGVYSVTFKNLVPPSGSKNDYMSMGPYWWPDPEKPDGLPYIRRDGEVNPERDKLDSAQKNKMINAVRSLSLAWFFSEKNEYAEKAAELLRVWFLNPETLMNPHLNYGQAIPGITEGRFIGIIDGRSFAVLVDAIALLETSGALTEDERTGLRNWFEEYFHWLTTSEFGKEEDNYRNNHSVAYDVQACGIAYFLGKDDYVRQKVGEMTHRRIDPMIEADGSQPHELIRTKAFGYSVSNLRNFFDTGELGLKVGVDMFNYENPKGGSLQKALDYLIGFIGQEQDWPYEQISGWKQTENNLGLLVRKAAVIYKNETYQNLWENTFSGRLKNDWRLLVEPEL